MIPAGADFDKLPHHDEFHAGPYGVEVPPDWSFAASVAEGSVVVGKEMDRVVLETGGEFGKGRV